MEEYINTLVDNTFKNYEFEQAKKIIADKISWYEMKLLNSVDKDKIRSLLKQVNTSLYHFKDSEKNNIMQRIKDRLEELLDDEN